MKKIKPDNGIDELLAEIVEFVFRLYAIQYMPTRPQIYSALYDFRYIKNKKQARLTI